MTGDEMERAIEFLLKSQANFYVKQAELQARQADSDARFEVNRAETNQQIRDLAAAQQRTQEQLNHLSEVVGVLVEGQQRSRDGIDVLVKLVGGLIERGNGKGAKDA
jgi:hypothetical protein